MAEKPTRIKIAELACAIIRARDAERSKWSFSQKVIVRFTNEPTRAIGKLGFLTESVLCEGQVKQLSGGFKTRFDRRPPEQGGDQLHIEGPRHQKWAYRSDGSRSEPNKYTLPTTGRIRDIVSQHFGIDRNLVERVSVRAADARRILVEVGFC